MVIAAVSTFTAAVYNEQNMIFYRYSIQIKLGMFYFY